jgi:hypothetical protein
MRLILTAVALRYPNGRIHETTVDFELQPGDRFDLYGRTWIAEDITIELRRGRALAEGATALRRLLCVPHDPSWLALRPNAAR